MMVSKRRDKDDDATAACEGTNLVLSKPAAASKHNDTVMGWLKGP
jgi:hypothetical protein